MRHPFRVGFSFGVTSAIITTLGLIIGLYSGTHSAAVIIGGIIVIAIADAFSDSLGIHISEESEAKHTKKEIWESMISTFFFKFIFALTFIIPILLFEISIAIVVNVFYGLIMLSILSFDIAKREKKNHWKVIGEHLIIAIIVIITTYYIGGWVALMFS